MAKAILLKIKKGKKDTWYAWCEELATKLRDEALLTLEEEQVVHELTLGFSVSGEDYVIGYMYGECLPADMSREVNKKHNEKKGECLERVGEVDILYDLKIS